MFSFVSKVIKSTLPTIGSIYIRLEKGDYFPGEQVSGTILLDLYTNWRHDRVYLTIVGIEQTRIVERVQEQKEGGGGDFKNQVYEDQNTFFSNQVPVFVFPSGTIPAGQFSFPFSFILKNGIPSSFNYLYDDYGEKCYATVVYEMRASLESSDNAEPALQYSVPFNVSQPAIIGQGHTRKEIIENVKSWCCIDKGQSKIVGYFEKKEYIVGEKAYMVAEVDNSKCTTEIKHIEGSFTQSLEIRARGKSKYITRKINTYTLPGIGPGETRTGENALRIELTAGTGSEQSDSKIQSTCTSRLITNHYYLEVKSEMDACICCGSHPSASLQLNLRNPPLSYANWSGMPSTWNPKIMQPATIQFTEATTYDTRRNTGLDQSNIKAHYAEIAMPVFPGMPSSASISIGVSQPGMPSQGMPSQGMPSSSGMPSNDKPSQSGMPSNSGMPGMPPQPGMPSNSGMPTMPDYPPAP